LTVSTATTVTALTTVTSIDPALSRDTQSFSCLGITRYHPFAPVNSPKIRDFHKKLHESPFSNYL
jgi:hypothetical protein